MATRLGFLVALVLAGLTSCSTYRARAYGGYTQNRLRGDLGIATQATPTVVPGRVDLDETLGIESASSPWARVELGAGPVGITASAYRYDEAGGGTLASPLGDLPAGFDVRSDLELINIKGLLTIDLFDCGWLRIAPGIGVDYFGVDEDIRAIAITASERIQIEAPAPVVCLQTELDFDLVAATVDVAGMTLDAGDIDGTYYDLEGLLRFRPWSHFEIVGGYRWVHLEAEGIADGRGYETTLELDGWTVGGGLTF